MIQPLTRWLPRVAALLSAWILFVVADSAALARGYLQVLFLGDNGGHHPHDRFLQLEPVMRTWHRA